MRETNYMTKQVIVKQMGKVYYWFVLGVVPKMFMVDYACASVKEVIFTILYNDNWSQFVLNEIALQKE